MENESPTDDGGAKTTTLDDYRNGILDRITRLQNVLNELYEVVVIFPIQLGTSQAMRVYSISAVEPDMLSFNGLLDNHTPATVLMQVTRLEFALITRKRFEPGQKAMTAFGFKNEEATDWS